jgi:hypothetical protein
MMTVVRNSSMHGSHNEQGYTTDKKMLKANSGKSAWLHLVVPYDCHAMLFNPFQAGSASDLDRKIKKILFPHSKLFLLQIVRIK